MMAHKNIKWILKTNGKSSCIIGHALLLVSTSYTIPQQTSGFPQLQTPFSTRFDQVSAIEA